MRRSYSGNRARIAAASPGRPVAAYMSDATRATRTSRPESSPGPSGNSCNEGSRSFSHSSQRPWRARSSATDSRAATVR